MIKKIVVGTKNPVKITAVLQGFEKMFPQETYVIEGMNAFSKVTDQPMSDKETYDGAMNRAKHAKEFAAEADFWVGIEGGLEKINGELCAFAWVVIKSKLLEGKSRTSCFFLPDKITKLIEEGKELGEADDIVFSQKNSKQQGGAVGILTENVMTRTFYYIEAVVLALIPFKNTELY